MLSQRAFAAGALAALVLALSAVVLKAPTASSEPLGSAPAIEVASVPQQFALALALPPATAPPQADPPPAAVPLQSAPVDDSPPLPRKAALPGRMPFMWQTLNNCGPSSIVMSLGYYGIETSQDQIQREVEDNPNRVIPTQVLARSGGFAHMTGPWDLIAPIRGRGLEAKQRWGGDIRVVRRLIASGFPVIVFQWLEPGASVRHFRIVRGYDDDLGVIYTNDSYLGQNRPIPYGEFMSTWRFSNRWYMPVYRKSEEEALKRALGAEFDDTQMWAGVVARAQAEAAQAPQDAEVRANLGDALAKVGMWPQATEQWEAAQALSRPSGLTAGQWAARMGAKLAQGYIKIGDPERALPKADEVLRSAGDNRTPWTMLSVAEAWRAKGDAYVALGDAARAGAAYQQALAVNPRNNDARKPLGLPLVPLVSDQ